MRLSRVDLPEIETAGVGEGEVSCRPEKSLRLYGSSGAFAVKSSFADVARLHPRRVGGLPAKEDTKHQGDGDYPENPPAAR